MTTPDIVLTSGDAPVIARVQKAIADSGQTLESLARDGRPIGEYRRVRFAEALAGTRQFSSLDLALLADMTDTTVDQKR